jgi:hypothetical protein
MLVPLPLAPSARSGITVAPGATPAMPWLLSRWAATVPATWVPWPWLSCGSLSGPGVLSPSVTPRLGYSATKSKPCQSST